jgi:hypothetical protein
MLIGLMVTVFGISIVVIVPRWINAVQKLLTEE